jgi:hypothetical protein
MAQSTHEASVPLLVFLRVQLMPVPLPPLPFADYCIQVQDCLEHTYGIPVRTRDIPDPLTGDLDGSEIHVDYAVSLELRLFLLAHLFGHTVQWNVDPRAFEIGKPQQPPVSEALLPELLEYEREAARYGLALLHGIAITAADQWYCDYTACDQAYLFHYYRTGEKRDPLSFWRSNTPLLQPKPVPPFTPLKRVFRIDGVVL